MFFPQLCTTYIFPSQAPLSSLFFSLVFLFLLISFLTYILPSRTQRLLRLYFWWNTRYQNSHAYSEKSLHMATAAGLDCCTQNTHLLYTTFSSHQSYTPDSHANHAECNQHLYYPINKRRRRTIRLVDVFHKYCFVEQRIRRQIGDVIVALLSLSPTIIVTWFIKALQARRLRARRTFSITTAWCRVAFIVGLSSAIQLIDYTYRQSSVRLVLGHSSSTASVATAWNIHRRDVTIKPYGVFLSMVVSIRSGEWRWSAWPASDGGAWPIQVDRMESRFAI